MFTFSLKRSLLLLVLAVVATFLVVRVGVGLWAWSVAPEEFQSYVTRHWILGTALGAVVLIGAGLGCTWLIMRTRNYDREKSRRDRLVELGLLSGGLAHEIRNTVNAMHTHIALLRKQTAGEGDSPVAARLNRLEQALQELEELTTDFLAFARPARDDLKEVDLLQLIAAVLEFVALDLEQSHVKVNTELHAELPLVYVDAGKVKRALLNLIVNARQAMPEGGTLTIRAAPFKRQQVMIEINDTGCGIPKQEQERIFQTFFSTKPDGTGLGLAVVKRTVEDCGGSVLFESEEGKGTTFRIILPVGTHRRLTLERQERQLRRAS